MKKTSKQYSVKLDKKIIDELNLISYRYNKVKNYIYSRYGSIEGLLYLNYPRKVRDEWVKNKFAEQWKLPSRYWKIALSEAFSNIKTNWSLTKKLIRQNINNRDLLNKEKHYINYILKSNDLLHNILLYKEEFIEKFNDIEQIKLNKIIRRLVRKYHNKSISKRFRSFMLDSDMYNLNDGIIQITSLTPRKRLKIRLTNKKMKNKGNLRIVIDNEKSRIELHIPEDIKIKNNNSNKIIGIDKGFSKMIVSSTNNIYGEKLSEELINYSEKLNDKNKQRNKIRSIYRKHLKNNNIKKANNIKKYNLGKIKYNNQKQKMKYKLTSYINNQIDKFIEKENPKILVVENLNFTNNKKKRSKKINRWLSTWTKGYLQERLEYKSIINGIEMVIINSAYTSQICHLCGHFGERKGNKFYCEEHGVVDADYNASVNILKRYYDTEISLFTKYNDVKKILISRLEEIVNGNLQYTDSTKT